MFAHPKAHYGYYQVGDLSTFSKVEALEWCRRFGHQIQYRFNDAVFDAHNWTVEPTATLTELYQRRARQIRDKYDYLVLFYSGGADSHNMLQSFVSQGIYVDEICSFGSLQGDGDRDSFFNREVFETSAPFAQNLIDTNPVYKTTKFRFIDLSTLIAGLFDRVGIDEFAYLSNSTVSINNVARQWLRDWDPDFQKIMESKSMCFVWGHDKPRTMHRDGKFGIHFMDINDNCVGPRVQHLNNPQWHDELFYNSPEAVDLIIKQAHEIMRFTKSTGPDHPGWTKRVTGLGHYIHHQGSEWQAYWLTQNTISAIVYPWFNPAQFYQNKPNNSITSERDTWFWKDQIVSSSFWTAINLVKNQWGDLWLNHNPNTGSVSTRNFCTTFRFIERD
jgi:hypothetical protein